MVLTFARIACNVGGELTQWDHVISASVAFTSKLFVAFAFLLTKPDFLLGFRGDFLCGPLVILACAVLFLCFSDASVSGCASSKVSNSASNGFLTLQSSLLRVSP